MPSKDSRPVRVLVFGLLLGLFASCEFAVGLYVNSLALLTDSIHLLTDVAAMVVGYKAIQVTNTQHATHKGLLKGKP